MRSRRYLPFPDIPGSIIYNTQEINHAARRFVDPSYQYKSFNKVTTIIHG